MRKLWTIAKREYGAMVATKAFLVSITLMPLMMFGGMLIASRMEKMGTKEDRRIVVADGSGGVLFDDLKKAADSRNQWLAAASANSSADGALSAPSVDAGKNELRVPIGATSALGPQYLLERHERDALTDEERLRLSERVRNEELAAFVEIPPGLADGKDPAARVRFYAQNPMLSGERAWLEQAVNEAVKTRRLAALKLDAAEVRQATAPVPVVPLGLFKQTADGRIRGADEGKNMIGVFLPLIFMMLMFMVIFMSAQPLLESVMEEKTGRIAEVLLGSVSPFQLMAGKLLGNVAGSLSVLAIYAGGGYALAAYNGWTDYIPIDLVRWFLLYQVLAVLLFSSLFMAVGAAVTQAKDAQALLLPIWLVICLPMFVWLPIVREPNGSVAMGMSFFPPATPMAMVLRLAGETVIPMWQILGTLAVLVVSTAACVYAAGRIFRIGILWQGKTPHFTELMRWAWRG
jgi:ABC-type Na+ efflux pump permease subunit